MKFVFDLLFFVFLLLKGLTSKKKFIILIPKFLAKFFKKIIIFNKINNNFFKQHVRNIHDIDTVYEIFRNECVKEFNKRNLKLHTFKKIPEQEKVLFFDYIHLNPPGNKIIAKNIFDIIKNEL